MSKKRILNRHNDSEAGGLRNLSKYTYMIRKTNHIDTLSWKTVRYRHSHTEGCVRETPLLSVWGSNRKESDLRPRLFFLSTVPIAAVSLGESFLGFAFSDDHTVQCLCVVDSSPCSGDSPQQSCLPRRETPLWRPGFQVPQQQHTLRFPN